MLDSEADVRQSTNRYFKDHLIVELSRDGEACSGKTGIVSSS